MASWTDLTNSLLERKHIKIPIEKRFFYHFLEGDGDNIQKLHVLDELLKHGYLEDDPRLLQLRKNLRIFVKTSTMNYEEFKYCIENHICILHKIFRGESVIPAFSVFCKTLKTIYEDSFSYTEGHNADYIPQLARVNPEKYGLSVCTIDGQRYNLGDTTDAFSVQSCCKPLNYGLALETKGEQCVHSYVGREPSGQAFNELLLNKQGIPHNPLINSGAIMTTSLLYPEKPLSDRFEALIQLWTKLSGGIYKIGFNNSVYLSEKNTADRNYALAHFMNETTSNKPTGFPPHTNIQETLELYFQSCSLEVTTQILSIAAATLANGGTNPFTGEIIFSPETVKCILSMMLTCGMYDYSGEFAFKIGLPAKSGVSGAVMIVVPNVMGIATWSPRLDDIGNSVRGIEFCKRFGSTFGFHIFDSMATTALDPTRHSYQSESYLLFSELCMAASQGDLEHIKLLFNREMDMNQCDYDGRTALHIAVAESHYDICKFLLQVGKVNDKKKDRWGHTPLSECTQDSIRELFQTTSIS